MSDKKQIKKAARNVKRARTNTKTQKRTGWWNRVWSIVCWPFRKLALVCKIVWNWIRNLELVGLLNLTLLVAIIVLFTMLIIDLLGCRKENIIVVTNTPVHTEQTITKSKPKTVQPQAVLPITQHNAEPVNVVPVKKVEVQIVKKQTARQDNKLMGDVIIDSRGAGAILRKGTQVNGNLYLQNMRKFTLPCNVRINGNLFLRDVNKLQFCGEFVVTGNIYVSPRSSFGPLPKNARIGGYVVL
ncbi:MAG: hypothetical protein E7006_01375 [Alphaproteobacteria bacterium]|nr:hypothetical protein [Alphaproteobacteria bacterium]